MAAKKKAMKVSRRGALSMAGAASAGVMLSGTANAAHHEKKSGGATHASTVLRPTKGNKTRGGVMFAKTKDGVKVTARVSGLTANQKHAIHIHEYGDIRQPDGKGTGGHYNPMGHDHGLPDKDKRHGGDLGNLSADGEGKAVYTLTVKNITIDEILGRGVIVHAGPDDGGQPTGNAGARIAQGTIGLAMKPTGAGKKKKKKAASSAPSTTPINAICPVSGKKVNPAKTCKFEGKTVAFCCGNCQAKFAKNPAQFAAKIKAK